MTNGITLRGASFTKAQNDAKSAFFLKNKIEMEGLTSQLNNVRSSSSPVNSSSQELSNSMNDGLQNVFTSLGNIAETKANNDQRRFREDLPFQSSIYQQFDDTADRRRRELQAGELDQRAGIDTQARNQTEGIDTRAREQNSSLTKDRMRLQSTQNMAEEQNRGKVQVNTTGQTRDADLKRALSVLPRK